MKKLTVLVVIMMFFSSCSLGGLSLNNKSAFFQDDRATANASFEKVLEAIQNKDAAALKSLFSKQVLAEAEFETAVNELFEFYQGSFVSYDDWGGAVGGEGGRENGKEWYDIMPTYDVVTTEQEYRFAFKEFTVNDFEPDKVGIWSLYVIKKEDDIDPECAYRGDGKWTPGINIVKKENQ